MRLTPRPAITAGIVLTLAVGLAGCTASGAAEQSGPTPLPDGGFFTTIPQTTNQPSDPPLPSDYDQSTNSALTPEEASLNQLWSITNSEVGADAEPSDIAHAGGLRDFAAAITARCYPVRSADQVAELEDLRTQYETLTGDEAFRAAQAYFARATALCM
ncbi:hypothetical protein DVJ78_07325 [Humibacter sp. BT305]|nr:hypothetical protein DVJ78_07325 [Humibacter sp. BT305]